MDRRAAEEEAWAGWMRAGLAGDGAAYRQLLTALAPWLRGIVRRRIAAGGFTGIDAEDVVQEALLAVHLKRASWDSSRPLRPWLLAVLHNKLVDALRQRGLRFAVPLEALAEEPQAPGAPDDGLAAQDVARALARLGTRQRQVVQLVSLEGLSAREAADRLGAKEGAVRVTLHRALQALAKAMRSEAT